MTFHSSFGMLVEHREHGLERDLEHGRRFERPRHRRTRAVVEHAHLAEQVVGLHQRDDALASVDRVGDRDRQPTAQHEVERVGRIALVEQDVAADQVPFVTRRRDVAKRVGVRIGEEVGAGEDLFVGHDVRHGTTLRQRGACRNPR